MIVFAARSDLPENKEEFFTLLSGGNPEVRAHLKGYANTVAGFAASKADPADALARSARQAYIAQGFAMAALAELEIDSCPMEGFDPAAVGQIL